MFERLRELFRADSDSLAGVTGPTAVSLHATVASPNNVTSPITGLKAAFFEFDFAVKRRVDFGDTPYALHARALGDGERIDHVGGVLFGGELVVDTPEGRVLLPAHRFSVEFKGAKGHGLPLEKPLGEGFEHIFASPATKKGMLYFNELWLSHGDEVQLIATLEPAGPDGYRTPSDETGAAFVCRPDLARVLIRHRVTLAG